MAALNQYLDQRRKAVQAGLFVQPPMLNGRTPPKPPAPAPSLAGTPLPRPQPPAQTALTTATGPRPFIQPPVTPPPAGPAGAQPGKQPIDFLSEFGPGNDLRFTQVNPYATERLRGVQDQVTGAAGALSGAPDLTAAAQEKLRVFEEAGKRPFELALQQAAQRAAATGTLGQEAAAARITGPEGILATREAELARQRRSLAADTAFSEAENRRANLGSLSGLEGQLYGQEAGQRQEVRGERGYQADTAQQAQEARIRERLLEESLAGQGAERQLAGAQLYGQQAEAGGQTAADLLSELAYQEQLKKLRQGQTTPNTMGI